ncbi:cytochrome c-type biogenesis protein [Planctobacterium marinum]|uniref:Cytochrome c-type biogenesis protein n=1 Tax=Planctobacterium marinum TaxID=1631968 RepID=A0AA48HIU7_9ALTE|nr:cytochrome c-type biogenesis protein CcmH [Planctobacterium marinum]
MIRTRFFILCFMVFSCLASAEEKYEFETEQQRADFMLLSKELRCPKCQNQNIADSNALIANDMKRKVHQLLLEGNSPEEVVAFMKARYGEFVHYQPPMTPLTFWLYFGPVLFVVLCFAYFVMSRRSAVNMTPESKEQEEDSQRLNKLKQAETALKDIS